jgi:alkylation response protein AidB-like acyl-CoA dehydrogenase
MRATNSGAFSFQEVPVQPEQLIGQPGQLLSSGLFGTEFPLSYGAVYLGLADAAFADTLARVNARDELRQSEIVRRDVADMYRQIQAAELTIAHAVSLADDAPLEARFLAATQLKRVGALAAHEVCRAARRIAGGSGLLKGAPIERICRDSESALVMPPSEDRCADVIGRLLLGGFGPVTPVRVSFPAAPPGPAAASRPLEPAEDG